MLNPGIKYKLEPEYRARMVHVGRHEAGHYVAARVLGFKTGAIEFTMLDLTGAHRASADIFLACPLHDTPSIGDYLERRITVLYAGVWAESLQNGELDPEIAEQSLTSGGGVHDHQKARELIQLLRNIRFPEAKSEEEINAGLATIYEELWMRAADIVKADHEMVEGLGCRVVSLATELGEPVGLSEAQLESLPAIKKRFGCAD